MIQGFPEKSSQGLIQIFPDLFRVESNVIISNLNKRKFKLEIELYISVRTMYHLIVFQRVKMFESFEQSLQYGDTAANISWLGQNKMVTARSRLQIKPTVLVQ